MFRMGGRTCGISREITQLPELEKYNAICIVVDRFTKRAHFFPITNEFSAKDLADLIYKNI